MTTKKLAAAKTKLAASDLRGRDLAGPILAAPQRRDPPLGDVEADDGFEMTSEGKRHRQSDIAKPNDRKTPFAQLRAPLRDGVAVASTPALHFFIILMASFYNDLSPVCSAAMRRVPLRGSRLCAPGQRSVAQASPICNVWLPIDVAARPGGAISATCEAELLLPKS